MLNRDDLIAHIMTMKSKDEAYARWALRWYHEQLPWLDLMSGVRDAINAKKEAAIGRN